MADWPDGDWPADVYEENPAIAVLNNGLEQYSNLIGQRLTIDELPLNNEDDGDNATSSFEMTLWLMGLADTVSPGLSVSDRRPELVDAISEIIHALIALEEIYPHEEDDDPDDYPFLDGDDEEEEEYDPWGDDEYPLQAEILPSPYFDPYNYDPLPRDAIGTDVGLPPRYDYYTDQYGESQRYIAEREPYAYDMNDPASELAFYVGDIRDDVEDFIVEQFIAQLTRSLIDRGREGVEEYIYGYWGINDSPYVKALIGRYIYVSTVTGTLQQGDNWATTGVEPIAINRTNAVYYPDDAYGDAFPETIEPGRFPSHLEPYIPEHLREPPMAPVVGEPLPPEPFQSNEEFLDWNTTYQRSDEPPPTPAPLQRYRDWYNQSRQERPDWD